MSSAKIDHIIGSEFQQDEDVLSVEKLFAYEEKIAKTRSSLIWQIVGFALFMLLMGGIVFHQADVNFGLFRYVYYAGIVLGVISVIIRSTKFGKKIAADINYRKYNVVAISNLRIFFIDDEKSDFFTIEADQIASVYPDFAVGGARVVSLRERPSKETFVISRTQMSETLNLVKTRLIAERKTP